MPSKLSKRPVPVMLIITGLIFLIWGVVSAFDMAFNGITTTGVVVGYERIHYPRSSPTHSHTVEVNERNIKITLDKRNSIGTILTLQYVPERPKTYWVKGRRGTPDSIGLGGLIIVSIGLFGLFVDTKT